MSRDSEGEHRIHFGSFIFCRVVSLALLGLAKKYKSVRSNCILIAMVLLVINCLHQVVDTVPEQGYGPEDKFQVVLVLPSFMLMAQNFQFRLKVFGLLLIAFSIVFVFVCRSTIISVILKNNLWMSLPISAILIWLVFHLDFVSKMEAE